MRKQNNNLESREGEEGWEDEETSGERKREQCGESNAALPNTCYAIWFDSININFISCLGRWILKYENL